MMLAGLGGRISHALQEMNNLTAAAVDVNVLGECVDEMSRVLFRADVRFKMVRTILSIIKKLVAELSTGHYKWRVIRQAFFLELCNTLDPARLAFTPEKGKLKSVISAGLQGSGIISNRTTIADHNRKKGWTPATVPADFFKTRAFDQLKLKASKGKIPFYGSYTETDAVNLVQEVADKFKEENLDVVLVDATICHGQEILLFEENPQGPDLVRFSMGRRIWEVVFDEGQVFKLSNVVRSFISTNMEGPAKGGSALTHVLSTANTVTATAPHQSLQSSPANQVDETLKQEAVCKESLKDDTCPVKGHRRGRNETAYWILSAAKGKEQDDDDEDDDDDDDEDNDDDDYEEEEDDDNDNKLEAGDDEEDVEGDEEEADDDAGEDGEGEDEADDNGQDDDGEEDGEDEEEDDVEGDEDGEEEPEEEDDEDGEQDPEEEDDDEAEGESEEDVEDLEPPKKKRK